MTSYTGVKCKDSCLLSLYRSMIPVAIASCKLYAVRDLSSWAVLALSTGRCLWWGLTRKNVVLGTVFGRRSCSWLKQGRSDLTFLMLSVSKSRINTAVLESRISVFYSGCGASEILSVSYLLGLQLRKVLGLKSGLHIELRSTNLKFRSDQIHTWQ